MLRRLHVVMDTSRLIRRSRQKTKSVEWKGRWFFYTIWQSVASQWIFQVCYRRRRKSTAAGSVDSCGAFTLRWTQKQEIPVLTRFPGRFQTWSLVQIGVRKRDRAPLMNEDDARGARWTSSWRSLEREMSLIGNNESTLWEKKVHKMASELSSETWWAASAKKEKPSAWKWHISAASAEKYIIYLPASARQ